ncbi:MAG: archaeal proteasome endopeptidase complex subunit beta [Candidatus Bathyarchaeota archaeon]|nr:MAG: archaeal proteasome endopeptidase complex subunit beta [Candidatus Bathyarchaeota archaeon]
MSERSFLGATTIGIVCKNGVVLASEKRISYGYMVVSKIGKKVFKLSDNIGAACAGIVADMQILTRQIGAYAKLYELDHGRRAPVRAMAKTLSNLLFQRRYFPYITQTIVGGVDDEGYNIYILDPIGSVIPDKYAAVGTGAVIAIGVLEAGYNDSMNVEEGRELVIRAMKSALARDAVSGNGVDILVITNDGIKEVNVSI